MVVVPLPDRSSKAPCCSVTVLEPIWAVSKVMVSESAVGRVRIGLVDGIAQGSRGEVHRVKATGNDQLAGHRRNVETAGRGPAQAAVRRRQRVARARVIDRQVAERRHTVDRPLRERAAQRAVVGVLRQWLALR